jgi:hypothetical protein
LFLGREVETEGEMDEGGSEGLGSTVDDGVDDLDVIGGHGGFESIHVLWAVESEDVIDGSHGL